MGDDRHQARSVATADESIRRQTMIDRVFDLCVELRQWLAEKLGMTYQQIKLWIFCVAVPALILGQTATIICLLCR
jgi:hypothetical protein